MKNLIILFLLLMISQFTFSQTKPLNVISGTKSNVISYGTYKLNFGWTTYKNFQFDLTSNGRFIFYDSLFRGIYRVLDISDTTNTLITPYKISGKYQASDTVSTLATKSDLVENINFTVNGNGNVIQTGHYGGYVQIPFSGHIISWSLCEGSNTPVSTSTTLDLWKVTAASYYPTVANTICGAGFTKPALSGATYATGTLSAPVSVTAGDWIAINIDANNNALNLNFTFKIIKK